MVKSKYGHLVIVCVVINSLSNLHLSNFLLIGGLQVFGPPIGKLSCGLFNDPFLDHLHKPWIVLSLAKLLYQFDHVLGVRQIEALLRLDASLLEGTEDNA